MGLAATTPHPEVMRAAERYEPRRPGHVDAASFDRVRSIAQEALAPLAAVVVVNRRLDSASRLLEAGRAAEFDTIHTATPAGPIGVARRAARLLTEHLHDTHGAGADAGRTVFGSTRFVGVEDTAAGAAGVLAALQRQGAVGVTGYGPVSFLVDGDATWNRTTFAAEDTALSRHRVGHGSQLPDIVAERLALATAGSPPVDELLAVPATAAAGRVREWLTSDALASDDGYIEAQVRGLRVDDVAALHVAPDVPGADGLRTIDPGAAPDAGTTARLLDQGRSLGLAT